MIHLEICTISVSYTHLDVYKRQGLGYKEVVEYLEGSCTKEEMIEKIKKETRHYAKRQLTWFRKNKETIWLDGEKSTDENVSIILGL